MDYASTGRVSSNLQLWYHHPLNKRSMKFMMPSQVQSPTCQVCRGRHVVEQAGQETKLHAGFMNASLHLVMVTHSCRSNGRRSKGARPTPTPRARATQCWCLGTRQGTHLQTYPN